MWSPVEEAWDEIQNEIDAKTPVLFSRTLNLTRDSFDELVCGLYSIDWGPQVGPNILRKIALLKKFPSKVKLVFSEAVSEQGMDCAKDLKDKIREKYSNISPLNHFTTIHISESEAETNHLLNIFLSENQ